MDNLENVVRKLLEEKFKFFSGKDCKRKGDKNILFFPRKKLKLEKLNLNGSLFQTWFISERLKRRTTFLEKPTIYCEEGITSGFRSGIILNKEGKYLKLKGITLKPYFKHSKKRGLCSLEEAFFEQFHASILRILPLYFPIKPYLVVPVFLSKDLSSILSYLKKPLTPFKVGKDSTPREKYRNLKEEYKFYKNLRDSMKDLFFVSVLEIEGDTRLDEAIYHLTKKKLKGEKKITRDNLLYYLCFWAGVSKAHLSLLRAGWSKDLKNTNCHIGNFVVYDSKGKLNVGIVDVSSVVYKEYFEENKKFFEHLTKELNSFRDDLDDPACCFPTYLNYNFFPSNLKDNCFRAIKTGYHAAFLYFYLKGKIINPIKMRNKIVVPEKTYLSTEEFKEQCNYILS